MVAWLVTWEWIGAHAERTNNIAAILNYRFSPERVQGIVELIYANEYFSLSERMAYARSRKNTPYPAQASTVKGIPWGGRITCGHNPFLHARIVDDLRVERNDGGSERLVWKERPEPQIQWHNKDH